MEQRLASVDIKQSGDIFSTGASYVGLGKGKLSYRELLIKLVVPSLCLLMVTCVPYILMTS